MLPLLREFDVRDEGNSARVARDQVVAILRKWRVPLTEDALDDVRVCTSEVVANAVEHGGGVVRVVVQWTGSRLRIDVVDFSRGVPTVGGVDAEQLHGRGMTIVDALAATWGWEPRGAGKTVYFLFDRDQPADSVTQSDQALMAAAR